MDIKLKRYSGNALYSKVLKIASVALIYVLLSILLFSLYNLYSISERWYGLPIKSSDYYSTYNLNKEYDRLLDYAVDTNVLYKSAENIENGNVIDYDELLEGFKNYYNVVDGIITNNTEINSEGTDLVVTGEIPKELEKNFIEYRDLIRKNLVQYKKMYINEQLSDYQYKNNYLNKYKNFYFYITDESGKHVAGNNSFEAIREMKRSKFVMGSFVNDNLSSSNISEYRNSILAENNYNIYSSINEPLIEGDYFYNESKIYEDDKDRTPVFVCLLILASFSYIILIGYLIFTAGKSDFNSKVTLTNGIDKIYNDIQTVFIIVFTLITFVFSEELISDVQFYSSYGVIDNLMLGVVWGLILLNNTFFLFYITSMARQFRCGMLFKNTLTENILRRMGHLFTGKTFRGWLVFLLFGYAFVNIVITYIILNFSYDFFEFLFSLGLLFIFNVFCGFLTVRSLASLTKIMQAAKETSVGNLKYKLDISEISPSFINFASDIEAIQDGLNKAVDDAVKGERMKAELITNVSHDLKTPLTSIISYIDLLKMEKLNNETAEGYVDILIDKAQRLKQLIEDLIEASKASSGNLTVNYVKVDLRQLFMQACGEFEEKITSSGLDLRINNIEEVNVRADGKHLWRIVENLLSNSVKYSMPKSRIYIDIFKTDKRGIFTVKNISANPIEVSADQLMERFVRGDEARTTEGSGLGLSITQSLTSLQGGNINISIDGDLFKVTIEMPLWNEEEKTEI